MSISPQKKQEIVDALRRGTVPRSCLDAFAVGLSRFEDALDGELEKVQGGSGVFKAVRGAYGSGKTFFARWLSEKAKGLGFATSEIQISETETPLHRLETVYRRLMEQLSTSDTPQGAFRNVLDMLFYALEEDVLAEGGVDPDNMQALFDRTTHLLEKRLENVSKVAPMFSIALRGYRKAQMEGDQATADAIASWMAGQPNVAAAAKRAAGVKGDIDHFGALGFLQGLLVILRDVGHPGLLVVLDEVETVQRMRSDVRDKSLNALRQLIDEVDGGRFPGLYLLITGTPAFFEGPQGVARLEPLSQRLYVDFKTEMRFDNPRAVQIRLQNFDMGRLQEVGCRIRDLYPAEGDGAQRIRTLCDDAFIRDLSQAVTGKLGGKVGIAPRVFLKKLVADILDRVDQHEDFDPRKHYSLAIQDAELTAQERQAAAAADVNDIELDL